MVNVSHQIVQSAGGPGGQPRSSSGSEKALDSTSSTISDTTHSGHHGSGYDQSAAVVSISPSGKSASASSDAAFYQQKDSSNHSNHVDTYDRPRQSAAASSKGAASSQAHQGMDASELLHIEKLKSRDREVKAHEMAHAAAGGSLASAPTYTYQVGPDGKRYAVGGEVKIDTSKGATPEETLEKARVIRAAANAPAQPSAQDRKVAAQAAQMALEAQAELLQAETEGAAATAAGGDEASSAEKEALREELILGYGDENDSSTATDEDDKSDDKSADEALAAADGDEKEEKPDVELLGENRRSAAEIFEEIYRSCDELSQRLIDLGVTEDEESPLASVVNVSA